jgi:hypothetical protein
MMVSFGKLDAEPALTRFRRGKPWRSGTPPSPMLVPLILRYGFAVPRDRMQVTSFSEMKYER